LELMQSRQPDGRDFLDVRWLRDAVHRWGLDPGSDPTAAEVEDVRRLRATMLDLVAILDRDRLPTNAELAAFNAIVETVPVRARLERHGDTILLDMQPLAEGWALVVRELAGRFGSLLRADPRRLKLCANPACRLAFYDGSKARTRIWHDNATCGNRERVRRFRERQAAR
jgi:predicted RNA-binding Zn ribbon-like protein